MSFYNYNVPYFKKLHKTEMKIYTGKNALQCYVCAPKSFLIICLVFQMIHKRGLPNRPKAQE